MKHYSRLSLAEKELRNRSHGVPRRCPVCELGLQPGEMQAHKKRCAGLPSFCRADRWLTWGQAVNMGAPEATLRGWVDRGIVRTSGDVGSVRYLLGDVDKCILIRDLAAQPRGKGNQPAKELTKTTPKAYSIGMGKPVDNELADRIIAYCKQVGGFAAASRKLDVAIDTLKRAANSGRVTNSTLRDIEAQLDAVKNV